MSVRSFQSSICVVFLSYWKDLTEHVVLFLVSSPFLLFFFVIISLLWETYFIVEYDGCERPAKLCYYSSDVQSFLLFLFVLLQYDGCERPVIEYDGCERPVIQCRSFYRGWVLLFFFILCISISTFSIIKDSGKQRIKKKVWGVIFNYLSSRAVHIDVTEDYGFDSMLQVIQKIHGH